MFKKHLNLFEYVWMDSGNLREFGRSIWDGRGILVSGLRSPNIMVPFKIPHPQALPTVPPCPPLHTQARLKVRPARHFTSKRSLQPSLPTPSPPSAPKLALPAPSPSRSLKLLIAAPSSPNNNVTKRYRYQTIPQDRYQTTPLPNDTVTKRYRYQTTP